MLTFEPETHTYYLDGERIEGFSEIIREAGLIQERFFPNHAMERGKRVHELTQRLDLGEMDLADVEDELKGYVGSWMKFKEANHFVPREIEFVTFHPGLRVGTTLDRVPLVEIKTGRPYPWHILQVALHWACLPNFEDKKNPINVYLKPDGSYPTVRIYTQAEMVRAFSVFSSIVSFVRWKRENYPQLQNDLAIDEKLDIPNEEGSYDY